MRAIADYERSKHTNGIDSRLLSLPAELRAQIFTYVLKDVRCRRPIMMWDEVSTGLRDHKRSVEIAILLTCRTTYDDCVSLLYDETAVDITVRDDVIDDRFPQSRILLGAIEECSILTRLRHIELEITNDGSDCNATARATDRLQRLTTVFKKVGKLKTIDLVFFDRRPRDGLPDLEKEETADPILEASMDLVSEKFIGVTRNPAARRGNGEHHVGSVKETDL